MKQIIKKGDKFGRLTAVRFVEMRGKKGQFWLFKCECGNEKVSWVGGVKRGHIKSCGCLWRKHGMAKTKTWYSWLGMRRRCLDENYPRYKDWGGRGITVCDRWMTFQNFYNDMGERPEGKTLDRIENNLGYCKENCCWNSPKQQCNNRRSNHLLTYRNRTLNISQWAEKTGIDPNTLKKRIYNGWDIKRALTTNLNI